MTFTCQVKVLIFARIFRSGSSSLIHFVHTIHIYVYTIHTYMYIVSHSVVILQIIHFTELLYIKHFNSKYKNFLVEIYPPTIVQSPTIQFELYIYYTRLPLLWMIHPCFCYKCEWPVSFEMAILFNLLAYLQHLRSLC